jgi:hypothetical protein
VKQQTISIHDSEALVRSYLDALGQRDLSRCMECFTEDATINMLYATFHGRSAIEEWHKDRFAANLELTQLNQVRVKKDTVVVDAEVTSTRLQSLRITSLRGSGTFKMENGKIREASFKPKMYNPLENWGNQ